MGWFISIMTPFCVTRQFHCPEVFFSSLPPQAEGCFQREAVLMEWPGKITLGTREEALVNTHEQSLSLAVSAEGVTIKRGDLAELLSHWRERHWFWVHLYFLFWRGYCRGLSLKTHCLLIFILSFDPVIQIYHVAAYQYLWVCTSKSLQSNQQVLASLWRIGKTSFHFNIKLQAGIWPIICCYRDLASMSQKAAFRVFQDLSSCR